MYSRDELFLRSLECYFGIYFPRCFATREINTKITFSWALKQFANRMHTLFSIFPSVYTFFCFCTPKWDIYSIHFPDTISQQLMGAETSGLEIVFYCMIEIGAYDLRFHTIFKFTWLEEVYCAFYPVYIYVLHTVSLIFENSHRNKHIFNDYLTGVICCCCSVIKLLFKEKLCNRRSPVNHMLMFLLSTLTNTYPDSKVHGANMGPFGPHVGPMNLAIRVSKTLDTKKGYALISFITAHN